MLARLTVVMVAWIGVGLICVGTGCFGPTEESVTDSARDSTGDVLAPTPIPVAETAEPTPISNPAQNQPDPVVGDTEVGTVDAGNVGTGILGPEVGDSIFFQPNLGWGNTINLLDLLDLLSDQALADILNPVTANPGSFTTLELLCLDEGFSDSFCRSRYGAP